MSARHTSNAMERTGQWVFSQDIPTDVVVEVGEANFRLHKFMLVAKSNLMKKLILESKESDLTRIDLTGVPGGPEIFEKAAKFCYGVNFEITVHNVAALRCAAEYLQMTDKFCNRNLAGRTDDFISQVGLASLSSAIVVLKSCEALLPIAEDIKIVQRCVEVVSAKACVEANFPSRSPPNWWTEELTVLNVTFFKRIMTAMKLRGAKGLTIASAIITYTERSLQDIVVYNPNGTRSSESEIRATQLQLIESIVAILPPEKTAFHISFLCCLLRTAIILKADTKCKKEFESRISAVLDQATVDDLLTISSYDGERLFDLDSVKRIVSSYVEKEKSVEVFNVGDFREVCSAAVQRIAKTLDTYLGEIAPCEELTLSKFKELANLIPKMARKVDDDLYRAIDIYLKAHPTLDEIEREKVCSTMDPLRLSHEARLHASQNKRLPVQVVLHALYYDKLQLRSGKDDFGSDAATTRVRAQADASLVKENEELRSELLKMKIYMDEMSTKNQASTSKKTTFFSSVSKKLGKLNPFKQGSKDTMQIVDSRPEKAKPRRRRFSIS